MDLTVKSDDNIHYMVEAIKKKLQLINQGVLQSSAFSTNNYDDLFEIYELVNKKNSFSVREMEGILEALSEIRKN